MTQLVNPFEEIVVFGKAVRYDVMYGGPPRAVTITRRPGTRGTGLRLTHVHNSGGKGGKATALQHYRGKKSSVGKAINPRAMFGGPASQQMAGALTRRGPKRGLQMIANVPKPKAVPGMSLGSVGSKGSRIAS